MLPYIEPLPFQPFYSFCKVHLPCSLYCSTSSTLNNQMTPVFVFMTFKCIKVYHTKVSDRESDGIRKYNNVFHKY